MELWIRSQDKLKLCKAYDLYTYRIGNSIEGKYAIENNDTYLGEYKTKERALEVLDEIQEHIENQGQSFAESNKYGIVINYKYYGNIYIMPKE